MNESENKINEEKKLRMKYYQGIRNKGDFNNTFITPPAHWLNTNFFIINQDFGKLS
jgi:hypothetical protein